MKIPQCLYNLNLISFYCIVFCLNVYCYSPGEVRRNKTFSYFDSSSSSSSKKTIKIEHPHLKEDNTTFVPTEMIFKQNNEKNNNNNNCSSFQNQNNDWYNPLQKKGGKQKDAKQNGDSGTLSTLKQNGSASMKNYANFARKPSKSKLKSINADVSDEMETEQTFLPSTDTVWIWAKTQKNFL